MMGNDTMSEVITLESDNAAEVTERKYAAVLNRHPTGAVMYFGRNKNFSDIAPTKSNVLAQMSSPQAV